MSAAVPATSTPIPKGDNVKYLVVGIDNKTGSINYITDDSDKIIDSAKDSTPFEVLDESSDPSSSSNTDDVKFVKIKVIKSLTQPINNSTDQRPYFELNKVWYTLILDAPVDPRETSGVVTSKWFGDYVLEKDPFSIFKRFYNWDLVVKNLKYLFNLPSDESNFNEVFSAIEQSKNGTFEEIQRALIKPFFAIKTVLDMGLKRDAKSIESNQTVLVNGYFINGQERYGYPNISGDKSNIITALQMLYDVRLISPDCISRPEIQKMHAHIKFRNYFLRKNESPESIGDFDTDATDFLRSLTGNDDVFQILEACLDTTSADCKIKFLKSNDEKTDDKNLVILKSSKPLSKTDGYELISQVLTLTGMNHHIYFNSKEGTVYNDVEIRKNQNLLFNTDPEKIWLYKKIGQTYRELLVNKYRISNSKIDLAIKHNPLLSFVVDRFLKDNLAENNSLVSKFMKQYLADESLFDLERLAETTFTGINYRHGICNYSGFMSPFIAAMQLIYDAVPLKSKIDYSANLSTTILNLRTFENQLLNTEYCLQRIFENIQTVISTGNGGKYNPLSLNILNPFGNYENIFYNYQLCVNYINNINIAINMANPINQGLWGTTYSEYALSNVVNNYYYKLFANNFVPGFDETTFGSSTASNKFFPGKYWSIIMETLTQFDTNMSKDIRTAREHYLQSIATDEEKKAGAYDTLAKEIIKAKSGSIPTDLKVGNFPAILKNECVSTIHKLIIVLFKGFNVFIDFEDDLRTPDKKLEKFRDLATPTVKEPNFVIKIASLPRLPVVDETPAAAAPPAAPTTPGKNWIKITGFDYGNLNAEYANGVYLPFNKDLYKHTEHNSIFIKYDGTKWKIYNKSDTTGEVTIAESTTLLGSSKWGFRDSFYNLNPTPTSVTFPDTVNPVTVENIGATYLPNPGEKVNTDITLTFSNLPDVYNITTLSVPNIKYTQVGTIYKSIYHDFFYKYYNEKHQILLSDCNAIYNVSPRNLAQNTVDMFPFIRLYKKDSYDLTTVLQDDVIYQDVLKWSNLPKP